MGSTPAAWHPPEDPGRGPSGQIPRHAARALLALLGVGVLVGLWRSLDHTLLREVLGRAGWPLLLGAALLYVPAWALRGWRWQQVARELGDEVPLGAAIALATQGNLLNLLLPGKAGDLLWANAAHRRWGIPLGRALVGVLSGRVLDLVGLGLLGAGALALLPQAWGAYAAPVAGGLGLGGAIAAVAAVGLVRWRWTRLLFRGPRLRALHDALVEPLVVLLSSPRGLARHLGSSALIWLNEGLVAWVIVRGVGLELPVQASFVAILVANLSKILPLTPGGFGTYEAAGALALGAAGAPWTPAVGAVLVEHLLKNAVNAALGAVAWLGWRIPLLEVDREALARAWRGPGDPG